MTDPDILAARARTAQAQREDAPKAMAEYLAEREEITRRSAELKAQRLAQEAVEAKASARDAKTAR